MKNLNLRIKDTPEDKGQKALNVNLVGGMPGGGGAGDSGNLVVHINGMNTSQNVLDKTFREIRDCFDSGGNVVLVGSPMDNVTLYGCVTQLSISPSGYTVVPVFPGITGGEFATDDEDGYPTYVSYDSN